MSVKYEKDGAFKFPITAESAALIEAEGWVKVEEKKEEKPKKKGE